MDTILSPKPTPSILELVSTIEVNATTDKFVAKEKFVVNIKINTECKAQMKISFIGDKFKEWFLDGDDKTKDSESIQTLRCHKLFSFLGDKFKEWFLDGESKTKDPKIIQKIRCHNLLQSSVDGPIITELGGEAKAETTLSVMFSLMEKQGKGEDGILLNNNWVNKFYIKDKADVLRTVFVLLLGGGWYVGARSVEDTDKWHVGCHVFSYSEPSALVQA